MLNREKYKDEILDIACSGTCVAVRKEGMLPDRCNDIQCHECYFYDLVDKYEYCSDARQEWCNSEYVEPPFDWSKVPVDTPILVRDGENRGWCNRHFAKFAENFVYAWGNGCTSWTANGNYDVSRWNYAKLAESED